MSLLARNIHHDRQYNTHPQHPSGWYFSVPAIQFEWFNWIHSFNVYCEFTLTAALFYWIMILQILSQFISVVNSNHHSKPIDIHLKNSEIEMIYQLLFKQLLFFFLTLLLLLVKRYVYNGVVQGKTKALNQSKSQRFRHYKWTGQLVAEAKLWCRRDTATDAIVFPLCRHVFLFIYLFIYLFFLFDRKVTALGLICCICLLLLLLLLFLHFFLSFFFLLPLLFSWISSSWFACLQNQLLKQVNRIELDLIQSLPVSWLAGKCSKSYSAISSRFKDPSNIWSPGQWHRQSHSSI